MGALRRLMLCGLVSVVLSRFVGVMPLDVMLRLHANDMR